MKNNLNYTTNNCTAFQLRLPLNLDTLFEPDIELLSFTRILSRIDLNKYFVNDERYHKLGRKKYDSVALLKVILFAFMQDGYSSTREIHDKCTYDVRFMWLLDNKKPPSHMTICNFMNKRMKSNIEEIVADINKTIIELDNVDIDHVYIDGSKFEANANKYSWVWKKASITSRNKLFKKITDLFNEINKTVLNLIGFKFETRNEYAIEYMEELILKYYYLFQIDEKSFVYGKGSRKTIYQRQYERLVEYTSKLKQYAEHEEICGTHRNSYAKTDIDATFMRIKRDYMGNDQLLPAYNVQLAICDEYILTASVSQYASDSDCFVPLIDKFKNTYAYTPKYVVGDAGYGSYNNLLYCDQNNIEKFIKFPMYEKTVKDDEYRNDIFKVQNFRRDKKGFLICPNNKKFYFFRTQPVKGNKFDRTEEIYKCQSCKGCQFKEQCHKGEGDRYVKVNQELTSLHNEVLHNLQSIHGALLLQNRSIQAEGAFADVKWNKKYKRVSRKGLGSVNFEIQLMICGFNLKKFHNKTIRPPT